MSEISAETLVKNVRFTLQRSNVIPVPVDPTLSNEGEAADAKATGDAIAAIQAVHDVNGFQPNESGSVTVYATGIPMTNAVGAQTVAEAVQATQAQTGDTIKMVSTDDDTIKDVTDSIITAVTNGVTDEEIDAIFEDWEDDEE